MADDLVTVTNNENPPINLEITTYKNEIDVTFVQSIQSAVSVHNVDENAHESIKSEIVLKANTTDVNSLLANKVDKITGKDLSTNDLTNGLKSNYDTAYQNSHNHSNKAALDLVSGTNTGDQNLSGLATTALSNLTLATALTNLGFAGQSLSTNGYYKFPGGLILQWGFIAAPGGNSNAYVTFPIAFPNAVLNTNATCRNTTLGSDDGMVAPQVNSRTTTGMVIHNYDGDTSTGYDWLAIGY